MMNHDPDLYPANVRYSHALGDLPRLGRKDGISTVGRLIRHLDGTLCLVQGEREMPLTPDATLEGFDDGDLLRIEGNYDPAQDYPLTVREARRVSHSLEGWPAETPDRYGGLRVLVDPKKRGTLERRSRAFRALRRYLDNNGFLEMDTPVLQRFPDGAPVPTFSTTYGGDGHHFHLRICPEEYLKRLLFGFDRVYELARCFRNAERSHKHSPEFTLLEAHATYTSLEDMMQITEQLVQHVALEVTGSTRLPFQGTEIDVSAPWHRLSVRQASLERYNVDPFVLDDAALAAELKAAADLPRSALLARYIEERLEPLCVQPTFLTHYPEGTGAPDKSSISDPGTVERAEVFVAGGMELANLATLNNDPLYLEEHMRRNAFAKFGEQAEELLDRDFLHEMRYGLPPLACTGVGVDRLVMLLTDSAIIDEVLPFPFDARR